jgi:hypothetical protein
MAEKTTSFTGPIVVGLNDKKGEIRLTDGKDVNEAKYLSIKAPDVITSDTTLTFPNGAGTAGQILSTDGNGGLSWVNDSAGNPAGTNGQVQTNDGGTFGAISEGTSGQVLTSNGAGSAPTFQAAPGIDTSGGAWASPGNSVFLQSAGQNNPTNYSPSLVINSGSILLDGNHPNGINNVANGNAAGSSLGSGALRNTAIGNEAGYSIGSGEDNTAIGHQAGKNITTGTRNTAVGVGACSNVGNGALVSNTAIGYNALQNVGTSSPSGDENVAIGDEAGANISSGRMNVIVGKSAGKFMNAFGGVAIGFEAGNKFPNTGSQNTYIGYRAGNAFETGNNSTMIGNGAQASSASVNNEITLGNGSISALRCQVTSITSLSDARDKKDVEDANIGLDFINDLRPVKFVWDTRDGAKKDIKEVGFIAQELDEVQQKHGVEDHLQLVLKNNPDKLEAAPGKLIPILVQAIKDLKKELDELKKD